VLTFICLKLYDADTSMLLWMLYPFFLSPFFVLFHFRTETCTRFFSVKTSLLDLKIYRNVQHDFTSCARVFICKCDLRSNN